jgi:hypothetical protein
LVKRTKRLTKDRALTLLQIKFGTQIYKVEIQNDGYLINNGNPISVWGVGGKSLFTRNEILEYENEMYSKFGM